ncbi:MAG: hypothetical protein IH948_02910, partial [Bacteroidetes bacterium]|nr:hypothetical protein [Bacteroidota bacterium]
MKQLLFFITFFSFFLSVSLDSLAAKYAVTPFSNQNFCTSSYPTAYTNVGTFSIYETDKKGFKKSQTETIILTLPAGFEFNTAAGRTVTFTPAKDITAITLDAVTATTITITVTTDGNEGEVDAIFFNNFEIRATAAGSGNLLRVDGAGGTFVIDNSVDKPTDSESLGYLFSDISMVYNSSSVTQVSTSSIRLTCGDDNEILEIVVNVSNSCPATITQFNFNTNGDAGFSENPLTNITDANVYYTGKTQGFSSSDLFGTLGAGPNNGFNIAGSQQLEDGSGNYYFYLAYDIPGTANIGDQLDARLDSFIFEGTYQSDMATPNPVGTRTITNDVCFRPDLPNPLVNTESIPNGSYVIPMDNVNQAVISPFNLKAYGLVHELLL